MKVKAGRLEPGFNIIEKTDDHRKGRCSFDQHLSEDLLTLLPTFMMGRFLAASVTELLKLRTLRNARLITIAFERATFSTKENTQQNHRSFSTDYSFLVW